MNPFAYWLLPQLGRATLWLVLAGVSAALLVKLARIHSPALHRLAWCAALLVGWSLVRLPLDVPWYAAELPVAPSVQRDLAEVGMPAIEAPIAESSVPPAEIGPSITAAPIVETQQAQQAAPRSAPPAAALPSWPIVALFTWASGVIALVAAWLAGYLWFVLRLPAPLPAELAWTNEWQAMLAGQGIRAAIALRVTPNLGPLVCRLPRGYALLVPEPLWRSLSAAERQAILRHELAHLRRGDLSKSLAVRILALPHWFNPVSWWAVRRFDEAAEWACDRAAAAGEPTDYAKILVHLGELALPVARYGSAMRGRPWRPASGDWYHSNPRRIPR